jgi:hypothetical protein
MLHRKIVPYYSGNFKERNNTLCMILNLTVSLMTPTATKTFWSSAEQAFVAQQSSEIIEQCVGSELIANNNVFFL